jgi:hypothetical protein
MKKPTDGVRGIVGIREDAIRLMDSWRGRYIISQALALASASIENRPAHQQEPSNVKDMKLLLDELFPLYPMIENSMKVTHTKSKPFNDLEGDPINEAINRKVVDGK